MYNSIVNTSRQPVNASKDGNGIGHLQSHRKAYNSLFNAMSIQRSSWRQVQQYFDPYSGRGLSGQNDVYEDNGMRKDFYRLNASPWLAKNDLIAGLSQGLTPKGSPFFTFRLPETIDNGEQEYSEWLFECTNVILDMMDKSAFYEQIKVIYGEIPTYGSSNINVFDSHRNGVVVKADTIGEFVFGQGADGKIDRIFRRKAKTVGALVKEYGNNCPETVLRDFKDNKPDNVYIEVMGVVPAEYYDIKATGRAAMPIESFYFIEANASYSYIRNGEGQSDDLNKIMKIGRFQSMPSIDARIGVYGNAIYGVSPVMQVLGSIKMLQKMESKALLALDKTIDPPMMVPDSLRPFGFRNGPGQINYYGQGMTPEMVSAVYNIAFNIKDNQEKMLAVQELIDRALWRDVFMAMSQLPPDSTAYLASRVWEEKLSRIGPTLEMLESTIGKVIDRFFDIAVARNMLPPAPAGLPAGVEMKVEYSSFLAQARKQIGTSSILQAFNFAQTQAQTYPEALKVWNPIEAMRIYNKALGINPKVLRSDDEIEAINQAEAQAAQQQMALEQAKAMAPVAKAAKDASETPVGDTNLLEALSAAK